MTPQEYGLAKASYSVREAMDVLSIGRSTFYEIIKNGHLTPVKLGKKTLIYAIEIAAFMERLRRDPTLYKDRLGTTRESVNRMLVARGTLQLTKAEVTHRRKCPEGL